MKNSKAAQQRLQLWGEQLLEAAMPMAGSFRAMDAVNFLRVFAVVSAYPAEMLRKAKLYSIVSGLRKALAASPAVREAAVEGLDVEAAVEAAWKAAAGPATLYVSPTFTIMDAEFVATVIPHLPANRQAEMTSKLEDILWAMHAAPQKFRSAARVALRSLELEPVERRGAPMCLVAAHLRELAK